jgi:uracil-DNA glycosylase
MQVKIEDSWKKELSAEFAKPYFAELTDFVKKEYTSTTVYPPAKLIFNAFNLCPLDQVKVVIIGQDPYHGPGQAMGLSFSVPDGVNIPPSLQNIYKEIESDLGRPSPLAATGTGDLEYWAEQGVLLLNATLTVRARTPGSHQGKGWEAFTDEVIKIINEEKEGVVFMLWGSYAQKKAGFVDRQKHLVLESAHPSPFAAHKGFFGNRHFSQANAYLEAHGQEPIEW